MTDIDERPWVSIGDKDAALRHEIIRVECGSGVHGMAIPGTDDHDEMGVYVDPPSHVLGLAPSRHHYTSRTVPQGVRSGPGDTDLTIYGLRKWMALATAGNPTVLTVLYAPEASVLKITPLGRSLRRQAKHIVSLEAGTKFLGYLDGQRERMVGGGRQSRVPNRPELIKRYGWDVKYASHALRLGLQGVELLSTGVLSLPLRPGDLAECMAVKRGEVSFEEALAMIDGVRERLAACVDRPWESPLPEHPDRGAVDRWLVQAHLRHWAGERLTRLTS